MKFLPLILAASCIAVAQTQPVLEASGGLTFPDINGVEGLKEKTSWTFRAGAGVAIPMSPQMEAVLTGQFAMGQAGGKLSEDGETIEVTFVPRMIEIDGSALWKASPTFGILGGLVVSIPMGGTYEMSYKNADYPEENFSDDGDIDDYADEMDSDVNTFTSLKVGGVYMLDERKSLQLAYLMPLGKYLDGDGFGCKIARLVGGISFRL